MQRRRRADDRQWPRSRAVVGSRSRTSTHESQIGVAVESEEIHQELAVVSQVESTDVEVRTEHAHAFTEQAQHTG